MSNSKEACKACKRASVLSLVDELDFEREMGGPVFPPMEMGRGRCGSGSLVDARPERNGSVSSASSVGSASSESSLNSTSSTGSERPVIRLKRLSAGKIHWVDGVGKGKGLNWFWFGLGRSRSGDDVLRGFR